MKRRDFLKCSLYATAMMGAAPGFGLRTASAAAIPGAAPYGRTLVDIMLLGGADLRFLFAPAPGSAVADRYWEARQAIYQGTAADQLQYRTYDDLWSGPDPLYLPADNAGSFGILSSARWLLQQYQAGNVAIVANVRGAENRRHDHAQLIVEAGDPAAQQFNYNTDGWGGRLVEAIGAANTVSVAGDVSVFAKGTDPQNRNARVIHAKDTRNFAISTGDTADPGAASSVMARALRDYYAQVRGEIPAQSPFRTFVQHEQSLRRFGDQLNERLASVPVPPNLLDLFGKLNNGGFAKQCVNVFDSFVGADLFNMRCISMNYGGWDTHRNQKARFEANISDILGLGMGLHTLTDELDDKVPGANDDLVYVFTTDFGRQLRANGDFGTDHGRGNYAIIVGRGVAGGTYGAMFPEEELLPDPDDGGQIPYDRKGGDIKGQTDFQLVLSQVCDWVQPGAGSTVFPNSVDPALPLEAGVDLEQLFAASA